MKVIILGAGQGKRLLPLTEQVPKALLDISGQSLIEHQIRAFASCGITDFIVVTGYKNSVMCSALSDISDNIGSINIKTIYNPFYAVADNLASCWLAKGEMEEDFIQVNGDNLFRQDMVESLLSANNKPITVAINHKPQYDEDDMKVMLDGDRLTEIGKRLPLEAVDAEAIGMYIFRGEGGSIYSKYLDLAMQNPDGLKKWFPSVVGSIAKNNEVNTCVIDGIEWCEVDFPSDLQLARKIATSWK